MGSPLGCTLARAFLCHYKILWLDNCPPEFKPVVSRRYVDNIFVLLKSKYHLLLSARYINTRHEIYNSSFSVLDVKIICASKGFPTYFSFS